jgi:hypothetical protein
MQARIRGRERWRTWPAAARPKIAISGCDLKRGLDWHGAAGGGNGGGGTGRDGDGSEGTGGTTCALRALLQQLKLPHALLHHRFGSCAPETSDAWP